MENRIQVIRISQLFFVADIFLIGLPILYFWHRKRKLSFGDLKRNLFLGKKKPYWIASRTIFLLAALLLLSIALQYALSWIGINDLGRASAAFQGLKALPLMLAYMLTVRVIAEEVFFRAFLTPRIGVVGSSILFGLAHYAYGSIAQIIASCLLGLVLGYWLDKHRSLLPNIVGHALFNVINLLAFA